MKVAAFARDHALRPADGQALVAKARAVTIDTLALSTAGWAGFRESLLARIGRYHEDNPDQQGIGRENLRLLVRPRLPVSAFRVALERQAKAENGVLEGAFLRLPGHEVRLDPADEALYAQN